MTDSQGGVHVHTVRVYYEDTDAGGVVYYANYLKYAERARTELMRSLGVESSVLQDEHGVAIAVRRCNARFDRPAGLDDVLEVSTRITRLRGASLEGEQIIRRGDEDLVHLEIQLACMRLDGGASRFPDFVRTAVESMMNAN